MQLTFIVNGVDLIARGWVKFSGIKYQRNDIDGPSAGREIINGDMIRDRVSIKGKWNVECVAMSWSDLRTLYNLILPETFTLTTNMLTGTNTNYTVYSNNVTFNFLIAKPGTDLYNGFAFPLIEV